MPLGCVLTSRLCFWGIKAEQNTGKVPASDEIRGSLGDAVGIPEASANTV